MSNHLPSTLRAAKRIVVCMYGGPEGELDTQSIEQAASIIESETGLPQLLAAAEAALPDTINRGSHAQLRAAIALARREQP